MRAITEYETQRSLFENFSTGDFESILLWRMMDVFLMLAASSKVCILLVLLANHFIFQRFETKISIFSVPQGISAGWKFFFLPSSCWFYGMKCECKKCPGMWQGFKIWINSIISNFNKIFSIVSYFIKPICEHLKSVPRTIYSTFNILTQWNNRFLSLSHGHF